MSDFTNFPVALFIGGRSRFAKQSVPLLVALTVTAGYWFTSSTFFANPAVCIARTFTDTFVGISPIDLSIFLIAQIVGLVSFLGLRKLSSQFSLNFRELGEASGRTLLRRAKTMIACKD